MEIESYELPGMNNFKLSPGSRWELPSFGLLRSG